MAKGTIATSNVASGLSLIATAGDLIVNRLLSSGNTVASATGNLSANVVSRGDLNLTAGAQLRFQASLWQVAMQRLTEHR
ncbi:hypothetical protein HED51_12630 [Ochrobactrum grignonense]|nr:hypothetical protein [Brucella grignonensis]